MEAFNENCSINFELYKVFYKVASLSSMTQAAEALFLTQPAVSKSIHNLETELGCTLFTRTQKGMALTEEGKALYRYISRAYNYIMLGQKKICQMMNMEKGIIRIGGDEMTVYNDLLPRLEEFNRAHPHIKIEVGSYRRMELVRALKDGEIDLGVVMLQGETYDGLEICPLNKVSYSFVAGPKYQELTKRIWSLEEILQFPIISLEKDRSGRKHLNDFFTSHDLLFQPDIELTSTSLIVPFAEKNLGIGIVARHFAEDSLSEGRTFEIQVTPAIPERQTCILVDRKPAASMASRQFLTEFNHHISHENKL